MPKFTKASFKAFLKNNKGKLFIRIKSSFDCMNDSITPRSNGFVELTKAEYAHPNNLGYNDVWLVGGRDFFSEYVDNHGFVGWEVRNSCGSFVVAMKDRHAALLKILSVGTCVHQ